MDRKKLLQQLIEERFGGTQAKFARAIGRSEAQVNQWLTGYRNIGEAGARLIEKKLKLPQWWMDGLPQATPEPIDLESHPDLLPITGCLDALIGAIAAQPQQAREALAKDLAILAVAPDSAQAKARVLAALEQSQIAANTTDFAGRPPATNIDVKRPAFLPEP
jgi:transcriptional regulator with XRE-family HTH domain